MTKPKTVTIEYHTGGLGQEVDHTIEAQVCPNCGSDFVLCHSIKTWHNSVECNNCEMCGPRADTVPEAVALWNRITM